MRAAILHNLSQAEKVKIDVHFAENNMDPTGLGEPTFPPVFTAAANVLYEATGKRYCQLTFGYL